MIDVDRPNWMDNGLCVTVDAALMPRFFPRQGQPTKPAKQICAGCAVREQCAEYALTNTIRFGVWGGMSEKERRQERRRRAAAGTLPPTPISHGTRNRYMKCVRRPEGACAACTDANKRYSRPDSHGHSGYETWYVRTRKRLDELDA